MNYKGLKAKGWRSTISSTGHACAMIVEKCQSTISSTGDSCEMIAEDSCSTISSTGRNCEMIVEDNYSTISSTGGCCAMITKGRYSAINTTGDNDNLITKGNGSCATSTGDYNSLTVGTDSVAVGWGTENKAKGVVGSYLVLTSWEYDNALNRWVLVDCKMCFVDGEKIKADTFYMLIDGEFVEVE